MEHMIERGWLGEKRGQGFYKRVGKGAEKEIHAIDLKTLEYHPAQKARFAVGGRRRAAIEDLGERLRTLVARRTIARARSCGSCSAICFCTRPQMVPEISDRIVEIDRAMRWGYAIKLGPVRAVGRARAFRRHRRAHEARRLRRAGRRGAHAGTGRRSTRRPTATAQPRHALLRHRGAARGSELEPRPGVLALGEIKRARGVVKQQRREPRWWIWAMACCASSSTAR